MAKKINGVVFLICLYGAIYSQSGIDLQYSLKYYNKAIHVTLKYTPLDHDSTTFTYGEPLFGGQQDIITCISNVKVSSSARLQSDLSNRIFKFFYSGSKPITIQYDIIDTINTKKDLRKELFRPMIQQHYFFSHGVNLFLNPKFSNQTKKAMVSIEWKRKPDFPLFYGFDPENRGKKICVSTVDSILFSLITGASDLTIDTFNLHGVKNYVVLRGKSTDTLNRLSIRNYFIQFNESIRSFWNDYNDQCFSLILQPFIHAERSISGVAFANGFIGKYKADTILNPERIYTISHEIGHHWIGHRLEMNISNQWFGEGFNDYITFNTLLGADLMNVQDYESKMNEVFKAHYSSPIKNEPNDSVFKKYWQMGDYNKLPYRRGCIFAFYLDNQIRLSTKGEKTIRDLLLSIADFRKSKPTDYEITMDDFIEHSTAYLPKPFIRSAIDDYILKGNPILFKNEMLMPMFQITESMSIPHLTIVSKTDFMNSFKYLKK